MTFVDNPVIGGALSYDNLSAQAAAKAAAESLSREVDDRDHTIAVLRFKLIEIQTLDSEIEKLAQE